VSNVGDGLDGEALTRTTLEVWTSLSEAPIEPGDGHDEPSSVWTSITIEGAWDGRVTLRAAPGLARTLAGAMFAMDVAEVRDAEVSDALAEVVNMIAGHVKALVPQPSRLSLPTLGEPDLRPPAEEVARCALSHDGATLLVAVHRFAA